MQPNVLRVKHRALHVTRVDNSACLLAAYEEQMRTDAESLGAVALNAHGLLQVVLWLAAAASSPTGTSAARTPQQSRRLCLWRPPTFGDPDIARVEWRTRGHDYAPGLHEALLEEGFVPGKPESIMIGKAGTCGRRPLQARGGLGEGVARVA